MSSLRDVSQKFASSWRAEVLSAPPMIAPARQYVYPQQIPGEEDALARGALPVLIHPATGWPFLATFALGFSGGTLPSALYSCPGPDDLCAVAGGYAYLLDTRDPLRFTFVSMRPVVEVLPIPEHDLLVFAGHHALLAWGRDGLAWESARLSWEGVRIAGVSGASLEGFGWDMAADREMPFELDLRTGEHSGGAFPKSRPG